MLGRAGKNLHHGSKLMRWCCRLLLCVSSLLVPAARVHAQRASEEPVEQPPRTDMREAWREPSLQLYGGLRLGVAEGWQDQTGVSSLGLQLGAAQVYRYAAIGTELRVSFPVEDFFFPWTDVMLKPALGFRVDRLRLRLYAACPLGVTIGPYRFGLKVEPLLGATWFLAKQVALNVELGVERTSLINEGDVVGYSLPRVNVVFGLP
jgi:hypothetical protein